MDVDPASIQPSRANKKATDLGVLGLETCKAALNANLGPALPSKVTLQTKDDEGFTASNWGKESDEEKDRKARFVRESRARQMDIYVMPRMVMMFAVRMFLLQKVFRSILGLGIGEKRAAQLVWGAMAVAGYFQFRAKPLANDNLESPLMRLPFIGSVPQMVLNKSRFHNFLTESIRAFGHKTAEITIPGGEFMAVMDVRDREYVLKTHFRNYLKNREGDFGSFEFVLGDVTGRGIFSTDKMEWQDSRKIASHMFSGASLKAKMEDVFNHHADMVTDMLESRYANTGKPVDMQEVFQSAIFDAFCEIAFGHFPNSTKAAIEGKKPPFLVAFDTCQTVATERFLMTPIVWHFERMLGALTGLGKEGAFARSAKVLEDYVRPIIDQRLKDTELASKNDLLSLYIRHARDTKQAHMLEPTYLRDTIINFMIAGRDTTSCTLAYTTRFIGENPEAERRLLEEVVKPLASKGPTVTWDASRTVPYADATFNEVLRMAPPVGDDIRICVSDDVWPSGVKCRDGTRVIIPNIAIGRDPFLWENPDQFNPDRWMSYDAQGVPNHVKRMDEYVYPVFFSGRRLCLGKDMARFESIVFMTKLFSRLRIKPLALKDDTYSTGPVIFLRDGSMCLIEKRT